mmetsp:Transcript_41744/g.76280  ORF Transcript_41744/g.76280 Transcript_41744/m.76280 type:complete len:93 (-) Transcript_41744:307-585(-)
MRILKCVPAGYCNKYRGLHIEQKKLLQGYPTNHLLNPHRLQLLPHIHQLFQVSTVNPSNAHEMESRLPNLATFAAILPACCNQGLFYHAVTV